MKKTTGSATDKGEKGVLQLTGNLGQVIKESAELAYTYAKNYMAEHYPENKALETGQIHLHLPEVIN